MDTQEIQNLISKGRIRQAFDTINKNIEQDDPRKKDLVLLSAQYNMLERDEMMGVVMQEDVQQSKKKIIQSLLELFM